MLHRRILEEAVWRFLPSWSRAACDSVGPIVTALGTGPACLLLSSRLNRFSFFVTDFLFFHLRHVII